SARIDARSSGVSPAPSMAASTARSSISGRATEKTTPASSSMLFLKGLPEARMISSDIEGSFAVSRLACLVAQRNDGGGGFLDRAAADVDRRPAVTAAKLPRISEFLRD